MKRYLVIIDKSDQEFILGEDLLWHRRTEGVAPYVGQLDEIVMQEDLPSWAVSAYYDECLVYDTHE